MGLALLTAERTTCLRRAVGCVLLNEKGHVLATGYNGVAAGQPHCNHEILVDHVTGKTGFPHACPGAFSPSGMNLDACHALHAEQNALLQCKNVWEIHTCFVTTSPCMTCVKLLMNTSCRTIYFMEEYPHTEARKLWEADGRGWFQMAKNGKVKIKVHNV